MQRSVNKETLEADIIIKFLSMKLDISHGTQCEEEGVTDVWGYNPKELVEEMEQLKIGKTIKKVEDGEAGKWMWRRNQLNFGSCILPDP